MSVDKYLFMLDDESTFIELVRDDFELFQYNVNDEEATAIKIISESGLKKLKELETKLNEFLRKNHINQKINIGNIFRIGEFEESPYDEYELNAYRLMTDCINKPVINFKLHV